jgi:hypothetical protein
MENAHKMNFIAAALGFLLALPLAPAAEPLPSWNEGKAKSSIVAFVAKGPDNPRCRGQEGRRRCAKHWVSQGRVMS